MKQTLKIVTAVLTSLVIVISSFLCSGGIAYAGTVYEHECNDTFEEANEIKSGDTVIGSVHGVTRNCETWEVIEEDVDDYYKFTLNSRSKVTLSYSYEGKGNWFMFLYDEDFGDTDFCTHAHSEAQTMWLNAGTYYINIGWDTIDPGKEYRITLNIEGIENGNPSQESEAAEEIGSEQSDKLINEITEAQGDFMCSTKKYSGKNGFCYKDSYFDKPATEYNHSLATMSLCLAISTYQKLDANITDNNVKDLLYQCGFGNENKQDNNENKQDNYEQYGYDKTPTEDSIGCAISSKTLEDGTPLIVIAVRSGGYGAEWASNLTVGTKGDHAGFDNASEQVYKNLEDYISKHNITGNVKLWLTGFSRGAATANLLAAKLNNRAESSSSIKYGRDDVYAYCFATPAGACEDNNPRDEKYSNIFNIIDYHDIVPLVAPYCKTASVNVSLPHIGPELGIKPTVSYWNFERYGETKIFPFSESNKRNKAVEENMISYLENMKFGKSAADYKLDEFENHLMLGGDSVGKFNRKLIGAVITSAYSLSNRDIYALTVESQFRDIFKQQDSDGVKMFLQVMLNEPIITDALAIHPFLAATAGMNLEMLAQVHANEEYYVAWMQSMDSNYVDGAKPTFSYGDFRMLKVNCPVDVFVYDSQNDLVAEIKDDAPQKIEDSSIIAAVDENEQKIVYLPADESYSVDIRAREDCKVSYTVDECFGVNSDVSKLSVYSQVDMKAQESLSADIPKYSEEELAKKGGNPEGTSTDYNLKKGDVLLEPTLVASADEIADLSFLVEADFDETKGSVTGGGAFTYGDFCKLTITPSEGEEFYGWYVNGERVSKDLTYRFEVTDDTIVKASFQNPYASPKFIVPIAGSVLLVIIIAVVVAVIIKKHKAKRSAE